MAHTMRKFDRAKAGLTLLEVMITMMILAIAITASLSLFINQARSGRTTEDRRVMAQWADALIDRVHLAVHNTGLTATFNTYAPNQPDSNVAGTQLPNDVRSIDENATAVISIINDETPVESDFGFHIGSSPPPIGADINGNGLLTDANVSPFPMDLNGDGDTTDNVLLGSEMTMLPIVVTVRWTSPYGPERMDVFTVVASQND